ncbi:hypothetical protein CUMW_155990 [Citrus unshiu]|nr:hypothetical protein CUMW_155990 [Citrus unshiu]
MSITTISDERDLIPAAAGADSTTKKKKKTYTSAGKLSYSFAYYGVGYEGMQRNPAAKTIEGDLKDPIIKATQLSDKSSKGNL